MLKALDEIIDGHLEVDIWLLQKKNLSMFLETVS